MNSINAFPVLSLGTCTAENEWNFFSVTNCHQDKKKNLRGMSLKKNAVSVVSVVVLGKSSTLLLLKPGMAGIQLDVERLEANA